MRSVIIEDKPTAAPHVCVKCGTGPTHRDHFVDLGFFSTLHKMDDYGQNHITEGLIYLCNECMAALIVDYMRQLNEFTKRQKVGIELHAIQENSAIQIQRDEIKSLTQRNQRLQNKIDNLMKIKEQEKVETEVDDTKTAEDLALEIFGEDNGDTDASGSDVVTDDSAEGSDDSVATGTVKDDDGDDSADESLTSSDLLDLKSGYFTATKGN